MPRIRYSACIRTSRMRKARMHSSLYTVTGNTNPSLFTAVNIIDPTQFRLDYAPGVFGIAEITIRATDTSLLFVEDTFTVTVANFILRF